ncbi:MAG TPA: hypothetical protein VK525_19510 [Candidatus Saccharimonadales bacterium]|nr:hypothetical protein [Candidatus Saccharimonadales bacterium]
MRTTKPLVLLAGLCLPVLAPVAARPQAHSGTGHPAPVSQLGQVHFPTSCTPAAQPAVEKGVALLHSFQYTEAELTFADAAKADPRCAMARWGMAMARYHQLWDFPQPDTLKAARSDIEQAQKIGVRTERERGYIAAAAAFFEDNSVLTHADRTKAYSESLAKLHAQAPDDAEASQFYALSLIALGAIEDIEKMDNLARAIAILNPIFAEQPNSPGAAHYLIHATDVPELAAQGLPAARAYAKIAPDSSHAIHMPSHIFVRLGLWQETIDSNIAASASAAHATEMHRGESHYQTHAMDFLNYAYLQRGQEAKARGVAGDSLTVVGASDEEKLDQQAQLLACSLMELHRWSEAAALPIPKIRSLWLDSTYRTRAIGAARTGDLRGAQKNIRELRKIVARRAASERQEGYKVPAGESYDLLITGAWLAFAQGKTAQALDEMRAAAVREEAHSKGYFGPPAREMLADMLFEAKRPREALAEYKAALARTPNRFDSLYGAGLAAEASGELSAAREYFSLLLENCSASADRPELAQARALLAAK